MTRWRLVPLTLLAFGLATTLTSGSAGASGPQPDGRHADDAAIGRVVGKIQEPSIPDRDHR